MRPAAGEMSGKNEKKRPEWLRFSGVGLEFAAAVAGFALVGWWVDRRWNTSPWGLLIGAALGLIGGTYNLIRESLAAFKPPANGKPEPPAPDER